MSVEATALVLAWVMILLLSLAMAGLMRQVDTLAHPGDHQASVSKLVPGSRFEGLSAALGETSKPSVVVFLDSTCRACGWVLPEVTKQAEAHRDVGFVAAYRAKANGGRAGPGPIRVIEDQATVFRSLGVSVTPLAAYLTPAGTVVNVDVLGSPQMLQGFVDRALERVEPK
jgi:hypothetical protein